MDQNPNSRQRHGTTSKQPPAASPSSPTEQRHHGDRSKKRKEGGEDEVKEWRNGITFPAMKYSEIEIGRIYSAQKTKGKSSRGSRWSYFSSFRGRRGSFDGAVRARSQAGTRRDRSRRGGKTGKSWLGNNPRLNPWDKLEKF
jgi:hypothetical protein